MEFRRIKPEENVYSNRVSSIAFLSSRMDNLDEMLQNPMEHTEGYERKFCGFDDNGALVSSLVVVPFDMHFDGHVVPMRGIGGVATLPENRKGGYIRGIFDKLMPEMYDTGIVFSSLFPFSFAFYRKFGYEIAYDTNQATVPMTLLRQYPIPDNVRMQTKQDDVKDFMAVYEKFSQNRNYAIVRSEEKWKELLGGRGGGGGGRGGASFAYIHYDDAGTPNAYVMYRAEEGGGEGGRNLGIREMAWTTKQGLHDMLGFLGGLGPMFRGMRWSVPFDVNVYSLFPESYEISTRRSGLGMNRVVNLKRALELLKAPEMAGSVVLDVHDKFLPVNTGKYAIAWEAGRVISVQKTDKAADMETDIETMAQVVIGYMNPVEAGYRQGTSLKSKVDQLQALFPKKDLYMMERF